MPGTTTRASQIVHRRDTIAANNGRKVATNARLKVVVVKAKWLGPGNEQAACTKGGITVASYVWMQFVHNLVGSA